VVGIGGPTSIFNIASLLTGKNPFTAEDVWGAIEANVGKQEEELRALKVPQPNATVPKLCLMHAVMKKLGIQKVHFQKAMGSCAGLLVSPRYWQ
jgi:hypothetical protein